MSLKRYGVIWISAGLATGVGLWYTRGPGMMGVDIAALVDGATVRGLAAHTGTNDYTFVSNAVTAGVLWAPLYETAMCGARTTALTAIGSNAWWVAGDGPEDAQDATLTADAPAPWTSLDSRVKATNTAYYGISATNVPLSDYLWSRTNTNAPAQYAAGAVPWADNWWTAAGLGTNVYRYACERPAANTYATNYHYRVTLSYAAAYPVGTEFYWTADYTTNYFGNTASVHAYGGLKHYTWSGGHYWFLGNPGTEWAGNSIWPSIGTLDKGGTEAVTLEQLYTVATNWPVTVNKGIVITNLNECRTVLTNLNRTVWFGWNAAEIAATNVIRYSDTTAYVSDAGTWPQDDPWDNTPETYYGLYAAGLSTWQTAESTNTATTAGTTLAERPFAPYADFWNTGYLSQPAGMQAYDVSYLYVYGGCRATAYPCDYAFRSNCVARLRVYVLVKDEFAELPKRWYKVCDAADPTNRPYFSLGNELLKPSEEQWHPFLLTLADFAIYGDGGWMESHPNYSLEGEAGGDLQFAGYAVVVDWKWRGL